MPTFSHQTALHPIVRGYWTDEEMLEATGAASIGVVKLMQRSGLITPRSYQSESGQRARAWGLRDMLSIALAVDLGDETGFNLATSVAILGALGKQTLSSALSSEALERAVHEALSTSSARAGGDGLPKGWRQSHLEISRKDRVRLVIVDRKYLFKLERSGDSPSEAFHSHPLGELLNSRTNAPSVTRPTRRMAFTHGSMDGERSTLEIKLCNLAELPLGAVGSKFLIAITH